MAIGKVTAVTKRKAYEDLLNEPVQWPSAGDRPFVASDNTEQNARFPESDLVRLSQLTAGYKIGADLMVDRTEIDPDTRDLLVSPIIFNYRHFLELALKELIVLFGRQVGVGPNWNAHALDTLWNTFIDIQERYNLSETDDADPIVEGFILEFTKIDPKSYTHRYPCDRKGNKIPLAYTELQLPHLKSVMQRTSNFFTGAFFALTFADPLD